MAVAGCDWRDTDAYAQLLPGDRRCFAWEWLRRSEAYVDVWSSGAAPNPFVLERLEDPAVDALAARPIWSAEIDRGVLEADGWDAPAGDRLDFARIAPLVTVMERAGGVRHILLSDGLQSIRVDLHTRGEATMPMMVSWRLTGIRDIEPKLAALAQLCALVRHGRFTRSLHPPERRAPRWIAMLRVHDAIASGASHRQIVAVLFGVETSLSRWRSAAGPWRLRVQRLAAGARELLARGPATWLQ